jgi:hypothetical protein
MEHRRNIEEVDMVQWLFGRFVELASLGLFVAMIGLWASAASLPA